MSTKTNHLLQITMIYVIIAASGFLSWKYIPIDDPILSFLVADLVMTVVCFIYSLIKKNSSVYDAYWSVIPFYFILQWGYLFFDYLTIFHWIAFAVVSLWSWRLTLNWARSWPDFSHEDWRYIKLAKDTGKMYPAVNFLGIHLFPTLLVFAGMWPLFSLFTGPIKLEWMFFVGVAISLLGIALEFFADNQLFQFRNRPNPQKEAILDTGLWGKMRYPNYLGEMLFWIGLFFVGHAFGAELYTGSGALAMCCLFVFISIPMKEARMLERRPNFPEYQKRVPKLFPKLFR